MYSSVLVRMLVSQKIAKVYSAFSFILSAGTPKLASSLSAEYVEIVSKLNGLYRRISHGFTAVMASS